MNCKFCNAELIQYLSYDQTLKTCTNCNPNVIYQFSQNLAKINVIWINYNKKDKDYFVRIDYLELDTFIFRYNSKGSKVISINQILDITPSNFDQKLKLFLTFD